MAKEETKLVLFLKSIGISGRYKGFYYLKEAVFLVLQDEHCLCKVQENIYRPIAERNHVSLSSVARAIRTVKGIIPEVLPELFLSRYALSKRAD